MAQYNSKCSYSGDYSIWQCTSSGKVYGIGGYVDLNFMFTNKYMSPLVQDSNGIRCINDDGAYAIIEWKTVGVGGSTYYFGSDGYAVAVKHH